MSAILYENDYYHTVLIAIGNDRDDWTFYEMDASDSGRFQIPNPPLDKFRVGWRPEVVKITTKQKLGFLENKSYRKVQSSGLGAPDATIEAQLLHMINGMAQELRMYSPGYMFRMDYAGLNGPSPWRWLTGSDGGTINRVSAQLSERDMAYLSKYYLPVVEQAQKYAVDPALVLGLGIESAFASGGTYNRTGDAFGMTGGSTRHMTTARSPEENVRELFANYGAQINGVGSDIDAFISALHGRDRNGNPVNGWKNYNSVNLDWDVFIKKGIRQMQRDIPLYKAFLDKNPLHIVLPTTI